MVTLGISVYPDLRPIEEIERYLEAASQHGYARVFTSMFSVEGTKDVVLDLFRRLDAVAHRYGMEVSLDINPDCMARLGATPTDLSVFAGIEADILRMDGAYGEDDNVAMLENPYGMKIEYNASSLTPGQIESLVARKVDPTRILACHNFYPQRYTGFRWDRFVEVNRRLSSCGIRLGAFVSSQAPATHGVWDATCGLPTVEMMRDYPSDLQARLLAAAGVTDVLFGNAYADEGELAAVAGALSSVEPHYVREGVEAMVESFSGYGGALSGCQRKVRVEPLYDLTRTEREILFDFYPHTDMGDSSEWIWRTRMPRSFYQDDPIPPRRFDASEFPVGSVLIVNDNYRHYAGEVQVVLRPVANDGTRNLVGRIDAQEMHMFDVIDDRDVVVFLPAR